VKLGCEVDKELGVIKSVLSLDASFGEKSSLVKRDLGDGCLDLEAGVPCTTQRAMRPPAEWSWMGEGGINDVRFWHSKDQLDGANRDVAAFLRDLSLIGSGVELAQIVENIGRKGKAFKDTCGAILRGDQSMSYGLVDL
jgi:hypothetical protein